MVKVTFKSFQGEERTVDAESGISLMEAAVRNSVAGIDGDCGGACACATCHVYVSSEWADKVGAITDMEKSMLEFVESNADSSRLACQITVSEALDGIVVDMPEAQY